MAGKEANRLRWIVDLITIGTPVCPPEQAERVAATVDTHWGNLRWQRNEEFVRRMNDRVERGDASARWTADATYFSNALKDRTDDVAPWTPNRYPLWTVDTEAGPVWWQDDIAARYLRERFGQPGEDGARKLLKQAAEHAAEWLTRQDKQKIWDSAGPEGRRAIQAKMMYFWGPPFTADAGTPGPPIPPRIIRFLARCLWLKINAQEQAQPMSVRRFTAGGSEYVKVPKALGAASWITGGPGLRAEIDGHTYTETADHRGTITRLIPRSHDLTPDLQDATYSHQGNLPLDMYEGGTPLAVLAVQQAASLHGMRDDMISPPAITGKVLVMLMATAVNRTQLTKGTLGELAQELYPTRDRIQKRDLESLAAGLLWTKGLHLWLPDKTAVQVFDIVAPFRPEDADKSQTILYSTGKGFDELTGKGGADPLFRGWFVLNYSGFMALPNKRPALQSHYIRAAAMWNDAKDFKTSEFDPEWLKPYSLDNWCALTNTLSQRTVEYLRQKRQGPDKRRDLSKDLKRAHEELEELQDEHGLIRIERKGRKKEYLILPPEELLEANRVIRQKRHQSEDD